MSAIMPGCDSDEEVFWGPVTAKELEIIWRRRMANKNKGESTNPIEKFIKNPEGLERSSGLNTCSMSSNSSVQEVPSLQDFRNSSGNQQALPEGNDNEHHREFVGNESTLPLLEASIVINHEIQNVNNSSNDNSDLDDISDQIVLHNHEEHLKCEPESSNQLDVSIQNPDLIQNIDLIDVKDNEDNINSTVDLNEIPNEITDLHQSNDMSEINASKECCDPTDSVKASEVIIASDSSSANFNVCSSDDYSNNDCDFEVVCKVSPTSPEPQQFDSVDFIDSVQPESIVSKSDCIESINLTTSDDQTTSSVSKINTTLNQSNIENIPPQKFDSVDFIDSVQPESIVSKSDCIESINLTTSDDQKASAVSKINTTLNQSNIENIPPEEQNCDSARLKEVLNGKDVAENIDPFRKSNTRLAHNVLQELKIEKQDESMNSTLVLKNDHLDKVDDGDANGASESSEERSFVSLNSEEVNFTSSSNSQYSSSNKDCPETHLKNKENEEPTCVQINQDCVKSKIPVSNQIKSTLLKPARLHHTPSSINEKWLNDLKRKKIPKPKKPDYMVSPAKLGSILKSRNQPTSPDKPDGKKFAQLKTANSAPKPTPPGILLTPKKKQYEHVKSPISQYIRTGTGIPTAKSLPVLQSPNKIPVPITAKQTPVQKLPPKFYSSAEKLLIKPGSSSSVPKQAENRPFLTPKIFKHQGRVVDSKKPGAINVITPRAVRKTSLTETSFACLPQSSKELEVSVLEEL